MKVTRKIGISFSVQSTRDTPWTEKYFTPVACILVFNLSDLSGRILATYLQWPGRSSRGQWTFFAIVLLRLSLIPICMLCNAAPTARKLPGLNTNSTPFFLSFITVLLQTLTDNHYTQQIPDRQTLDTTNPRHN